MYSLHLCLLVLHSVNYCVAPIDTKADIFHSLILSYSTLLRRVLLMNNTTVTIVLALYIYNNSH